MSSLTACFCSPEGNATIAGDPTLSAATTWIEWQKYMEKRQLKLESLRHNLIDKIWVGRPSRSKAPLEIHRLEFAGKKFLLHCQRNGRGSQKRGRNPNYFYVLIYYYMFRFFPNERKNAVLEVLGIRIIFGKSNIFTLTGKALKRWKLET